MNKDEIFNGVVLSKSEFGVVQNPSISNGFDSKSELGVVSMNKDEVLNDGSLSNSLPFIGCNGYCSHHKVQFEFCCSF
jgi:hypothetical protein